MSRKTTGTQNYDLKVLKPDHKIITDPFTGVELTFLTSSFPSSSIYFHERSWLVDSSMIVFRGRGGVLGYLTGTGELVEITTPTGPINPSYFTAGSRKNVVFCMRENDVLELTPTIEVSPDVEQECSRVTMSERTVATLPLAGQINCSYDDTFISAGLRGTPPSIHVIEVETGNVRQIGDFGPPFMFRGHVQWSRTASNLLCLSAGPDWHKPGDPHHTCIVDPKDGVPREVYRQVEGELVTHQSWWVDDQILFCGAPQAVGLPGDPELREMSHVNALEPRTGVVRIIGAASWWPEGSDKDVWRRNWWHCAGSEDGRWVVADTFAGDIVLFEGATTRPHLLTTGHRTQGIQHPEPGWDRRGDYVLFSSHMLASLDDETPEPCACIARIPVEWQTECTDRAKRTSQWV
jgi:hypothetical protein